MERRRTTVTHVGTTAIGGDNPIRVQSMTTTNTNDTVACVEQTKRIVTAGGELVRLTTQGNREAENMRNISAALKAEGIMTPLVADVHFNANVADTAALYCEKVRINPGNYVDPARTFKQLEYTDEEYAAELRKIESRFVPFLDICREHNTAVRIGVNHGSLSDRIMSRYGDTPAGIVESCLEFLRICRKEDFNDVVISIKASNTVVMVQSVRLLVEAMDKEDMHYPLHLGVTEAGEGEDGRIKSAVGIGALLTEGIGDTIRVSLSEEPECEIPVAKKLVAAIAECAGKRENAVITDGTLFLSFSEDNLEDLQLKAAMSAGALLIDGKAKDLVIENHSALLDTDLTALADSILQAARVRFTKPEFISCPGCGRTLYDLQSTIARIKEAVNSEAEHDSRFKTLKIGIMGCIVNGPGEMADADFGYVGAGPGRVSLYKQKECVQKNIPAEEAVERLMELIKANI
ncbi:(E)-4-hydroxy-3-methylbut-2-enyl-diphosphate synthase [Palleniella muris]|uniref:(E)-4-hydroxy-3-methylbut-2-enyl-diphosphate synthase n=1 Tax=Palleniella muris TaxID=3038145 RepID=A0AC61QQF1_9BACT|nr:(E)-4-hydroxy-3-methylbut-2-enyl-diphosphate synthase [Palleniella muris]TGX82430.1 (E)-4-hydroxy-3-methylbut-2-enyl-diphosphate synthase [Palleniella muris]